MFPCIFGHIDRQIFYVPMDYENLSIRKWAVEDRPREKLISKGTLYLSDAELLAILISSGNQKESALGLAKRILNSVQNNLNELGKLVLEDLLKFKGIGKAKAITIMASLELGRRRKSAEIKEKQKVTGAKDVFRIFNGQLADIPYEEFWVLYLNRSNKIIDKQKISQGGISGTVFDIRLLLKTAILKLASSVIVCHNHPSGNLNPSQADKNITNKLKSASELMDIKLLDHVIVNDNSYFSFCDEGMI